MAAAQGLATRKQARVAVYRTPAGHWTHEVYDPKSQLHKWAKLVYPNPEPGTGWKAGHRRGC